MPCPPSKNLPNNVNDRAIPLTEEGAHFNREGHTTTTAGLFDNLTLTFNRRHKVGRRAWHKASRNRDKVGLHCAPAAHRTLGTFPAGTVRFGLSDFNTAEGVEEAIEAVREMAR